jgi:hypothetical protein
LSLLQERFRERTAPRRETLPKSPQNGIDLPAAVMEFDNALAHDERELSPFGQRQFLTYRRRYDDTPRFSHDNIHGLPRFLFWPIFILCHIGDNGNEATTATRAGSPPS